MTMLVTPEQMRAAERSAIGQGRSERELMRAAAEGMAAWLEGAVPQAGAHRRQAVGLVGPGNNGGDALVTLALLLERGWDCFATWVGRSHTGDLPAADSSIAAITRLEPHQLAGAAPQVIVDGIFGVGGRAQLPEPARQSIAVAHAARRQHDTLLVAVDVPSGIDPGTGAADEGAFHADATLCLGLPKIGMIREPAATLVGELVVIDIGIAAPAASGNSFLLDASIARSILPARHASAHKSTAGGALLIGGSPNYYGAPRLAAEAAARAGAGLVCLAVPSGLISPITAQVPEVTFHPRDGSGGDSSAASIDAFVGEQPGRFRSIIVGPGLGRHAEAASMLDYLYANGRESIRHVRAIPTVLDADALNWLALRDDIADALRQTTAVLTPHPGEMARLTKTRVREVLDDPTSSAAESASAWGQVVVLKTGYSVVAEPDGSTWVAPRAMPELATAGTGDVLAGLIGGFLAQGRSCVDAARLAMYVGAIAGLRARCELGILSVMARDVIDRVPGVLRDLMDPRWNSDWIGRLR